MSKNEYTGPNVVGVVNDLYRRYRLKINKLDGLLTFINSYISKL